MTAVETYRRRPTTVQMMLWDGTPNRAEEIRHWVGAAPSGEPGFRTAGELAGVNVHARLRNSQERCWIPCPVGHRVVCGVLGEFHPISAEALVLSYEPVNLGHDVRSVT